MLRGASRVTASLSYVARRPYLVFLILGSVFGLFQAFFVPAFGMPDEGAHLNRIYQITEGHLFGQTIPGGKGEYIPESLVNFEHSNNALLTNESARIGVTTDLRAIVRKGPTINETADPEASHFENTELYNPVAYTPQVIGMFIAKLFDFSDTKTLYFLRVCGLTCWLVVGSYAIKKMGQIGWAAVIIVLTPLSVQIAASVSGDGIAVAASLLFMGFIIDFVRNHRRLGRREYIILLLLVALLACVKLPYIVLAGFLLLLPAENFRKPFTRWRFIAVAAIIAIALVGSWTAISQQHYIPYRTAVGGVYLNPKTQDSYVVKHPLGFAHKLYETYLRSTPYDGDPVTGYIGELGLLDYGLPGWAIGLYFIIFGGTFAALRSNPRPADYLKKWQRWYGYLLTGILFLLVNILIFISWSRISYPVIEGIQSRYFIPVLLPLTLVAIPVYKSNFKLSKTFYVLIPLCLVLIQLAAVLTVFYRFYAGVLPTLS